MLLIYGQHGNGKTHLARGAMMVARARGVQVMYYTIRQLMALLREAMDTEGESADGIIKSLRGVGFLVLDELGTEDPKSDWQAGVLEDIVNHRYDNELPTILVTNGDAEPRSAQNPEGLSPAIASRLKDSKRCLRVLNRAPDYRPKTGRGKKK
jgi:DNA replication protein DnaC